ncbi:MAG: hypothetical protein M3R63_01715 [Actinomycetota bacterium]|nr:hypothetical protein [Actinomycetota bacterium]
MTDTTSRPPPSGTADDAPTHQIRRIAQHPSLISDRLGRCALAVVGVVVVLSVVRAFLPMPWLGDIWRPADTATIAHNFFVGG